MKEHDLPEGLPNRPPEGLFRRLSEDLPEGYRLIRAGVALVAVKKQYAEAFSNLALPEIVKPHPGGHHSGRGRLASIALTDDACERALVRRYIRGGFFGRFCKERFLDVGRPRPLRELLISEYARDRGVSTPEVLAAIVQRDFRFFYRGALVMREIAPGADLQEVALTFASQDRAAIRGKRRCIKSLGRLIAHMHGAGIYHADLHLKNILKSGERLYVLDLDAASLYQQAPAFRKRMNLLRLYRSVEKINRRRRVIKRTDLLRFIHSYADESKMPAKNLLRGLMRMLPLWRLKWRLSDLMKI